MRKQVDHQKRALIQIVIPTVFSILLLFTGFVSLIPFIKNQLIESRKHQTKELVTSIYSMIDKYYNLSLKGYYSEEQAKDIIIETIKSLRYGDGNKDYFWLLDHDNNIISHPYYSSFTSSKKTIEKNRKTLTILVSKAIQCDEGFIEYNWQWKDDASRDGMKISFVKDFKPWKWVVGTGFYIKDVEVEIKKIIHLIVLIMSLVFILISILYVIVLRRALRNVKQIIRRENDLVHSEKRFRGMAQNIDSGLIIMEGDKIVFHNKKIGEIFGLSDEEMEKFSIYDFLAPEEINRFKSLISESFKTYSLIEGLDLWIVSKDNKRRYLTNRISYELRDNIQFTYILTNDVTEKKETGSRIKSLTETINQSPDSTIITDLQGNITYVNKRFEKLTGYSFDEVKGRNPRLLKSDKMLPALYTELWKTITSGKVWKNELLNKKKSGELYWERTIIFPIFDENGEIVNYAAIKTDITRKKQLENELVLLKDQAKVGEKIKNAFLNNISHEVRTPLTAINGFSNLLKEKYSDSETACEYLSIILKNSETLLHLFQSIIEYSSIASGDIKITRMEVGLCGLLRKIASKHNVKIVTEGKKTVEIIIDINKDYENAIFTTDRNWFLNIIENLLSNAVKYTEAGTILVGFNIDYENIIFYVSDTGVGIPVEEQKNIFETFTHGNNLFVSLHKGAGLGLNIAKLLIEHLGGKLWFETEENVGTTFYFSFSSVDVKNYTLGLTRVKDFPYINILNGKSVLIAEDNEENFIYMKSLLNDEKTEISWAKNGNEALNMIENDVGGFDLIFMDVFLPGVSLVNTRMTIKNSTEYVPVIAMISSNYSMDEIDNSVFDAVLTKPFKKSLLFSTVNEVLSKLKPENL